MNKAFPPKALKVPQLLPPTCISASRKEFLRQRQAAVTLQAGWRGYYNRRNFKLVRGFTREAEPAGAVDNCPVRNKC